MVKKTCKDIEDIWLHANTYNGKKDKSKEL